MAKDAAKAKGKPKAKPKVKTVGKKEYLAVEDNRKTVGDHGPMFSLESGGGSQMLHEVLLDKLPVHK